MTNAAATNPIVEFPSRPLPTLRESARRSVGIYRTKQQRQASTRRLIADLRARATGTRAALETSDVEQVVLRPLYENLLRQLELLDALEATL